MLLTGRQTAAELTRLSAQPSTDVRAAVAAHPNTPAAVLGRLAAEFPAEVLGNPALSLLRLAQPGLLAGWPTGAVLELVRQPALPDWLRNYALAHADARFQVALAGHPALNPRDLDRLARHPNWKVRGRLGVRPDFCAQLLSRFLHDPDYGVRLVLAARADLPPDAVNVLSRDGSSLVRRVLARRLHAGVQTPP